MFFKKKQEVKKKEVFNSAAFQTSKEAVEIKEPETLAKIRLEAGARDYGYNRGLTKYNSHKTKVQNQWINPLQSINSGFGNSHLSVYNYQNVNYYECYALAQDPLFNKIFDLLSKTPFANGGDLLLEADEEEKDRLNKAFTKYKVFDVLEGAIRSSFVSGGCLVYMDFGLDNLEEPLDLRKIDMRDFKGFRHIDPINVVAVDVDTTNPASADYMEPEVWYIIGLGNVHKSHVLKFEENVPERIMRPLCLYFGMPLTLLVKQDIANSNLASQGLANLLNRFRYLYLKTGSENFTGDGAFNFRARLEAMSLVQDNYSIYPLKDTEEMQQFTTSVNGLAEQAEFFYQIIAAKTDITISILLGKGASGLSGTLEGERKNFYDRIRRIQQHIKPQLLTMCGIIAGKISNDGKFVNYPDYVFNPLEQADEREKAENLRSYVEVARSLIDMGVKGEDALNWLKSFKDFKLDHIDFDTETEGLEEYDIADIAESQGVDIFNADFKEADHPRDKDGKFTDKGAGSGGKDSAGKESITFKSDPSKINVGDSFLYPLEGKVLHGVLVKRDALGRVTILTAKGEVEISPVSFNKKIELVKDKELSPDSVLIPKETIDKAIEKHRKNEEEFRKWLEELERKEQKPDLPKIKENELSRLKKGMIANIKYSPKEKENIAKYGIPFSKMTPEENLEEAFIVSEAQYAKEKIAEIKNNLKEYLEETKGEGFVSSEAEDKGITEKKWLDSYGLEYIPTEQDFLEERFKLAERGDLVEANRILSRAYDAYIGDVEEALNNIVGEGFTIEKDESRQSDSVYFTIYTNDEEQEEKLKIRIADHKSTSSGAKYGTNDFSFSFGHDLNDLKEEITEALKNKD